MKFSIPDLANRVATTCIAKRFTFFAVSSIVSLVLATGLLSTQFDGTFNALLTESDPYLDELVRMDD